MDKNKIFKIASLMTLILFLLVGGIFKDKVEDLSINTENAEELKISEDAGNVGPAANNENISDSPVTTAENSFSFAILGDTQRFEAADTNGGFQKAIRNISAKNVELVMTEGDLLSSCSDGCSEKLIKWRSILGSLAPKTYVLMGNHDRTGKNSADEAWRKVFNLPNNGPAGFGELVYSFDFKNSHFVILNSEKPKEHVVGKEQRDWLENDLASNKKENIFVFFHEPAYPVSSKIKESLDAKPQERDALWNILSKNKVTAVFNGHEHIHSRRKVGNLYQFVFGNTDSFDHELPKAGVAEYSYKGKHFGLVKVEDNKITVELYSVDGQLINSFELKNSF